MAAHINPAQGARTKALIIPREHGAWGMLLVPLLTGAIVGLHSANKGGVITLFLVAAVSLFWLRTPLEAWLGTSAIKAHTPQEQALVLATAVGISTLAAISIAALLWNGRNPELLLIGAIAMLTFALQALVKKLGRRGRMPAQIIGAIGLTSTSAGAYYVATGKLDSISLALWLMNWLFAADQVHFVQLSIHGSRAATLHEKIHVGRIFLLGQAALACVVFFLCWIRLVPAATAIAFVPILIRGTAWFVSKRLPLNVHKLGFTELAQSLIFAALLCAALLL